MRNPDDVSDFFKQVKKLKPEFNCIYVSSLFYKTQNIIMVTTLDEKHNCILNTIGYHDFFDKISEQIFNLISQDNGIVFNQTTHIFIAHYKKISMELITTLGTPDFKDVLDKVNQDSPKINSRILLNIDSIELRGLHNLDHFLQRLKIVKKDEYEDLFNQINYYSEFTI